MGADLHRTIQAALAGHRLGTPVFVRYFVQGPQRGEAARRCLGAVRDVVRGWFGRGVVRCHRVGATSEGHVCEALEFRGGATALLSWAVGPVEATDVTVLGNQGAAYHEAARLSDEGSSAWPTPWAGLDRAALPRKRPHGILLVTGGHTHQETYAAAFAADRRCRLIGLTDEPGVDKVRQVRNRRLAADLRLPYVPDLDRALQLPDVDVASVCAPPQSRAAVAVRCATAGKHLYLDKSLAPSVADARAVAAAVRKAGVLSHMFSHIPQPWARRAKAVLASGRLGQLKGIHADVFFAKGPAGTARLGRRRREEFPPERHQLGKVKRELDNVGVYPITLIRWLTGRRFRTVRAFTANYFFAEHQELDVEDFGILAGTLEGDLPVTIAAGRCGWTSHPSAGLKRLLLVGSAGTVIVDALRPRLELYTAGAPWTPPALHAEDPMGFWDSTLAESGLRAKETWVDAGPPAVSDASYFLDCLDAGHDSEINAAEAALATAVLEAAYRSAAVRAPVSLPTAT